MLWHILKFYLGFVIAFYFKRIKVKNAHYLKVKGPVIVAINHPNAFMDPIAFTTQMYPPRLLYLARGDAFKKGIVSALLESLGIIPIFRIQDGGKEGLQKNNETYDRVNTLLSKNKKIIIFAEGLCIQERRLRPLKKGVPRMIFGAMETHNLQDLTVVPVGLNYDNPSAFRSNLFCNIGKPIKVADYMKDYAEFPAKTMNSFLADLYPKMKELIIHIQYKETEKLIENCEEIYKPEYFFKHQLNSRNLEDDFNFSTQLTSVIEKAHKKNPDIIQELTGLTSDYLVQLKKLNLNNGLFCPLNNQRINAYYLGINLLFLIITLPISLVGIAANALPFLFTSNVVSKKVKIIEFKSSFAMGIGAFSFLIYYIIQYNVLQYITPNVWLSLLFILIFILSGLFVISIFPMFNKTMSSLRFFKLRANNPTIINNLLSVRKELIVKIDSLLNH